MLQDRRLVLGGVIAAGALALGACGSERSAEAFCERVEEARSVSEEFSNLNPQDLEGTQEAFNSVAEQFERISEVAPEEIQGDVEQINQVFDDIAQTAGEADSPEALERELQGLAERIGNTQQANQRVTEFQQRNCENGGGGEQQGG